MFALTPHLNSKKEKREHKEFSKRIIRWNTAITCFLIITAIVFTALEYETSLFTILIPSMIGLLATAQAFYYNKAKLENLLKIKLSFIKFKQGMEDIGGTCEWLDEDLGAIQQYIDNKVDEKIEEAISEDIIER